MGRIKSLMIKKGARQLMAVEGTSFNKDFEKNKRILGNSTMPSKSIRNKIAGYIARLKKVQKV